MIATIQGTLPAPTVVVLAAGHSARLGRSKALATVRGVTLLARTLRVLEHAAAGVRIIVVVPPRAGRYRIGHPSRRVTFVANHRRGHGLSTSVQAGIREAARGRASAVLLLPVDLVRLDFRDIGRLVARWRGRRRTVVGRRRGTSAATPLILPRYLFADALCITGDQGLRDWARKLPSGRVALVPMPSAEADIDTPLDLERARRSRCTRLTPSGIAPGDSPPRFP